MGLLTLAVLLAATNAPAAAPSDPLAEHAAKWAAAQGAGAVVLAERSGGAWRYAIGGQAFAKGHDPVPPEKVLFEIGSISKVFTGLLLAHAIREGKLAAADTLASRLPVTFDSAAVGGITLRQLATHTSCLPRLPSNLEDANGADPYARYDDEKLVGYLSHAKIDKAPPCAPDYSNLGFMVLGVVLERAYGKPWSELVREKITGPLGMSDTAQTLAPAQSARFAEPWAGTAPAKPWTFKAASGAGALRSTAGDLARFADALIAGAGGPLKEVWGVATGDEVAVEGIGGKNLVIFREKVDGEDTFWHNGGTGGFRSSLRVFPSSGRATVVLTSNANTDPDAWVAAWRAEGRPKVERKETALVAENLAEYPGVYALTPQARFTVLKVGDGLRVRLTGQTFLPVFPSAKDEFFYKAVDAQLSFRRDAAGVIEGLTLHQNGRDLAAKRLGDPVPHVEFPAAETLTPYEGMYDFGNFQPGATITVKARGDVLGVQLTGQPLFPVFATGADRFEYDVVVASLTFERDAAGKVVAVVLHQNGADMRAPRATESRAAPARD